MDVGCAHYMSWSADMTTQHFRTYCNKSHEERSLFQCILCEFEYH